MIGSSSFRRGVGTQGSSTQSRSFSFQSLACPGWHRLGITFLVFDTWCAPGSLRFRIGPRRRPPRTMVVATVAMWTGKGVSTPMIMGTMVRLGTPLPVMIVRLMIVRLRSVMPRTLGRPPLVLAPGDNPLQL